MPFQYPGTNCFMSVYTVENVSRELVSSFHYILEERLKWIKNCIQPVSQPSQTTIKIENPP